jgi:hypothetical protein
MAWFHHIDDEPALADRLQMVGISDNAKWLSRLSTMSLSKFRTTFLPPSGGGLLQADMLPLEEAIGLATGQLGWTFRTEEQPEARNAEHADPEEPASGVPVGSRRLNVGERPPHFQFDTVGAFKLSREFSCLVAAVAAAGPSARYEWYPKVLRAFVAELGPLVGYYLDKKNRAKDLRAQVPYCCASTDSLTSAVTRFRF